MSRFNRLFVSLLALAALALAVLLLIAPQSLFTTLDLGLASARTSTEASRLAAAAVLAALALVLVLLEAWPHSPRVFQTQVDGGTIQYAAEAVAQTIERELAGVDGVQGAQVGLAHRGSKVDVRARLGTGEGHEPHHVAATGAARIREKLGRAFGLEVGDVRLAVQPVRPSSSPNRRHVPDAASQQTPSSSPVT